MPRKKKPPELTQDLEALPPPGPQASIFQQEERRGVRLPAPELPPDLVARLPSEVDQASLKRELDNEVGAEAKRELEALGEGYVSSTVTDRLRALLLEKAKRKLDALNLYEPLPVQSAFHESHSKVRVLRGSNRGGKTLPAAVEVARAVTGRDPFGKYPKEDGRWFCVGKDLSHIGQVVYRKLFRPGAFKMIRDRRTRAWRAFRPWSPEDRLRAAEARPAPPLIPPRMVKSIAWENKAKSQPSVITLTNGWEMNFYSSLGKPPQGSDISGWWFDEEIVDPDWFPEMMARCVDRHGVGIWSATPQAGTDQLYDLHEKAEEQARFDRPTVSEFVILLASNPHLDEEEKRALAENLSDEERAVRIGGDFALLGYKMYPEFSMILHGVDYFPIPSEWCRYAVVDPGHQVCAVLFAAIPPPHQGGARESVFLYDELYLKGCDASKFAEAMSHRATGQCFQAFLIDPNMAIYTEVGYGKTVGEQYSEALRARGVSSVSTGCHFLLASDNLDAGPLAVREWLRVREDGTPKLRVMRGKLPNFEWEIVRYHRKKVAGQVVDRPDQKRNNHLMDCFDAQTEVLTREGWVFFSNLPEGAEVATVNLRTDKIEYQRPPERVARNYAGPMMEFGGRKLDALVTPNHRMVVYPKKGYAGYSAGAPVVKLAKEVTVWDSIKLHAGWDGQEHDTILLPKAGRQGRDVRVDAGDWAEFLGWYIAEGSCSQSIQMPGRGYQVVVSQVKEEGVAAIDALLSRLPWKWNRFEDGFRTNSCRQLWEQLVGLGNRYTKRVPAWIKDASPRIIERFLAGAVGGDGWTQGKYRVYATVSKRLADDIQELFIKAGKSASIREVVRDGYTIRGRSGSCVPQYWVQEWTCPHGSLRNSKNDPNFRTKHYRGMVYCVSVPNGTLIVRRNGKPMVAGNCLRYLSMYAPRYVRPDPKKVRKSGAVGALKAKREREKEKHGGTFIRLGPGR